MTEFSMLMGNINSQISTVNVSFEKLNDKVNGLLGKFPGFLSYLVKPLVAAWNKVVELSKKMWHEIDAYLQEPGDPGRLNDAGTNLSDKVQSPVSAQAGKFTETYMKVDDKWKGDAAEQYKKVLEPNAPQSSALRQYAATVAEVSKALNKCRWAIITFWIAVGTAYATLIGALMAAIIGVVSIVGAIPALLYAAGCIAAFVVAVIAAGAYAVSEMSDAASTFRTQNNGNDHLAGGKWPPSGVPES
ncbi:hypothetical protein [Actinomadura rubrisoli]|uniref:Uncharacterized protein n=1 Tax=Actinomadura rubrisoli TaxID=2530368 RepID=A0A4R5C6H2_9ACTN|nr:hypothetical protein [Actinomadura rubrisoli]TDD94645.1 hypothetical protein E1298_06590 [Actinomadura rubrisoli]